jgi:hypothetical protein
MKGLRFPLWLICDAAAALRLALATCLLSLHVRLYWPKHATQSPSAEGIACICVGLACCEALLRWAIMRQAFRVCGRDPRAVRIFRLPLAASSFTWQARCRTFLRLIQNMSRYARRWAERIHACGDDDEFRIPNPAVSTNPSNPSNFRNPNPSNPDPSNFRMLISVAIRGPPRLTHTRRLPTASRPAPARPRTFVGAVEPIHLPGQELSSAASRSAWSSAWRASRRASMSPSTKSERL